MFVIVLDPFPEEIATEVRPELYRHVADLAALNDPEINARIRAMLDPGMGQGATISNKEYKSFMVWLAKHRMEKFGASIRSDEPVRTPDPRTSPQTREP